MNFIKNLFSGFDRDYLLKSYLVSLFLFTVLSNVNLGTFTPSFTSFYFIACAVFFPFATIVWDSMVSALMGNNIIVLSFPFLIVWKVVKLTALFTITPILAPIGMMYIYSARPYKKL